jgi:hypothetical protein
MTALDRINRAATNKVDTFAGEWITLITGGATNLTIRAVIDRTNRPPSKFDTEIPAQGEVGVTVYIRKRQLNTAPSAGMLIQESDAEETTHTVGEIKDLGYAWQLFCSSSPL